MGENDRRLGTLSLFAAALGVGASAMLNKLAMGAGLDPVWLNILRLGCSVLVMLPFFLASRDAKRQVAHMSRKNLLLSLLAGGMLAVHFLAWASSLRHADSLVAVAIWSTFSLLTVVGSAWLLKEKTPFQAILGILVAIVGVGVCAIGASGAELKGVLLAMLAAVTQAVYTLCGRAVRREVSILPYTMVVYSVALGCQLVAGIFAGFPAGGISGEAFGAAILLALVCTLGGHSTQNYALRFYKAPVVSAVIMTEVFIGPLLVFLAFGEVPRLVSVFGGLIIVAGVAWVMWLEWNGRKSEIPKEGGV